MGRAYDVRKASIQKTGAAKAKLYSMYAREIYQSAKQGGSDVDSNLSLKRLLEKAKKDQVPGDIIKRAIDKVSSGASEDYETVRYEIIGPGGSSMIVIALTDNVNRTLSHIRPILNKNNGKMGVTGSVSYLYDHLAILKFSGVDEEGVMNALIEADVDLVDLEVEEDGVVLYGEPVNLYRMKDAVHSVYPEASVLMEEISWLAKDPVILEKEDLDNVQKMLDLLDDVEDVSQVYHNVTMI